MQNIHDNQKKLIFSTLISHEKGFIKLLTNFYWIFNVLIEKKEEDILFVIFTKLSPKGTTLLRSKRVKTQFI